MVDQEKRDKVHFDLPLLPLRNVVVYPYMVLPLFVGREKSIKALEQAMVTNKKILLVSQREEKDETPTKESLYSVGTVSNILQLLKLPDGTVKVLVEGMYRAELLNFNEADGYYRADVNELEDSELSKVEEVKLIAELMHQFEEYSKLAKKISPEVQNSVSSIEELGRLMDTMATHLPIKLEDKQEVLETFNLEARLDLIIDLMQEEIDL